VFGNSIDEVRPGGIGLHLMRQMMNEVRFEFEGDRNLLSMLKTHAGDNAGMIPKDSEEVPNHEVRPGVWLISPEGRLDAAGSPRLDDTLTRVLEQGRKWLVVDMSGVSYISSRGLKTLVSAWRKSGDAGGTVVPFGMMPRVASIFDTVGFTHIFDSHQTLEDALAAIDSQKR
jgi:anti-anti-sigma factor